MSGTDWTAPAQYILQKGLVVEDLRDEIYCQLIKQTSENPSHEMNVKYWELITFCSATFLPTPKLFKYLGSYLQSVVQTDKGSIGQLAQLAVKNLIRQKENGPRKLVPSSAELEALRDAKPMVIKIHLTDGSVRSFIIDSASTVLAVSDSLSSKLHLRPDSVVNGFSLVEVFNSIERDLSKDDKVADSLAKFENLEVAMNEQKMNVNAKLVFKRRLCLDSSLDNRMERELLFHQITGDILSGALPCAADDIVAFGALKLQVDCGDYTEEKGRIELSEITKYIPPRLVKTHTDDMFKQWQDLKDSSKEDAKSALYNAATQLPLFSHNVFEVSHDSIVAGLPSNLLLAINSSGIHFVEKSTQNFLRSHPYATMGPCKSTPKTLTITWDQSQKSLELVTTEGTRIMNLMRDYLETLRTTAKFAKALKDYHVTDENLLSFRRGDIITIISRDKANQWYVGECEGRSGTFPVDHVELLPGDTPPVRTTRPQSLILSRIKTSTENTTGTLRSPTNVPDGEIPPVASRPLPVPGEPKSSPLPPLPVGASCTDKGLLAFARNKFRTPVVAKGKRPPDHSQLLSFTKDPIKDSLIEIQDSKVAKKAASEIGPTSTGSLFISFDCKLDIMGYMEDYPVSNKMSPTQLVQAIVQQGIDAPELRDEIYCQIWKQATGNPREESTKKGYELLLFCANSFAPSITLLQPLTEGLESRGDSSPYCKSALEKIKYVVCLPSAIGRLYAPSTREIEYLQNLEEHMMCKVLTANHATRAIFINSYTTIRDASTYAFAKMNLTHNAKHFGIFELDEERDTCNVLPDGSYVCDFLSFWENTKSNNKFTIRRKLFFEDAEKILDQENLWTSDPIGFDLTFCQVRDEVLAGKYPTSEKDAAYLAALLVQIRHPNSSKAPITKESIALFIPRPLHGAKSIKNWISAIELHLFEVVGQTPDYTRLVFLKAVAKYPMFGSLLFPAHHKESNQKVLLSISRKGVSVYDLNAKDPKVTWTYSAISSWTLVGNCFVLMTGNLMKPIKATFQAEALGTMQLVYTAYSDLLPSR